MKALILSLLVVYWPAPIHKYTLRHMAYDTIMMHIAVQNNRVIKYPGFYYEDKDWREWKKVWEAAGYEITED